MINALQISIFFGVVSLINSSCTRTEPPNTYDTSPQAKQYKDCSIGDKHSIAITTEGYLYSWGANDYGQLGLGSTVQNYLRPQKIGTDSNWSRVFANGNQSFALKTDGTLWCWGDNQNKQLGSGSSLYESVPVKVNNDTDWALVAPGFNYTLAIKTNGTLWAWGTNDFGQLGIGNNQITPTPIQVGTETDWKFIAAGTTHAMAIKTNGTLWAWGDNSVNAFGNGNTMSSLQPIQVGTDTWKTVSAGNLFSMGIKTDGTLWGTGKNNYGQCGNQNALILWTFFQIGTNNNWNDVKSCDNHSIANTSTFNNYTWGNNPNGCLANNTTNITYHPSDTYKITPGSSNSISLSDQSWFIGISKQNSFYVTKYSGHYLMMVGSNSNGQLGYGTTTTVNSFVFDRVQE